MNNLTRSKMIQIWFAAVLLMIAAAITFGVAMTATTGAMLFVMSLVPPTVLLLLWPTAEPVTISEVLRAAERRG